MPHLIRQPLAVLAALAVLAGCGGETEPLEYREPAEAVEISDGEVAAEAGGTPGSWGVGKGEGLPGDAPDEPEAPDEPAPVVSAPAPTPQTAPTVRPPEPSEIVDRDDHVDFALDFLGRQAYNDVGGLMDLYAGQVRYFDRGTVSRSAVAEDKAAYFERWPNRYFEISGPVRATRGLAPTIRFDYAFAVSDFGDSSDREGRAWVELGLTPGGGGYVIASERGGTY